MYQTTQTDSNFIVQNEFSYLWSRGVYFGDTWWTMKVVQRSWVYGEANVEITECINYAQSENCKSKNLYTFSLILMKSNWKHPKIVSKSGPKSLRAFWIKFKKVKRFSAVIFLHQTILSVTKVVILNNTGKSPICLAWKRFRCHFPASQRSDLTPPILWGGSWTFPYLADFEHKGGF